MSKIKTPKAETAAAPAAEANGRPKRVCPVGRAEFAAKARPVTVVINGVTMAANPKDFSTGSLGWYAQGKVTIDVGGVPVDAQIGLNLTAVGSKELPKEQSK